MAETVAKLVIPLLFARDLFHACLALALVLGAAWLALQARSRV